MDKPLKLRPEVLAFAQLMERVLQENDHKGGWKECKPDWLVGRIRGEAMELRDLVRDHRIGTAGSTHRLDYRPSYSSPTIRQEIAREATDVANFCMMIADVCGCLDPTPAPSVKGER